MLDGNTVAAAAAAAAIAIAVVLASVTHTFKDFRYRRKHSQPSIYHLQ